MARLEDAPPIQFAHEVDFTEIRQIAPQDDEMREINKFAKKPMTRQEVAIYRLDLVNDKVDRHFTRFPEKELNTINRMIVGKPLMEMHATRTQQPVGTFFQSQIVETVKRGESTKSVRPDVYIPRIFANRTVIEKVDAGVIRGTSIGFQFEYPECSICQQDFGKCQHMPGVEYDVDRNGKRLREECHVVMHDVTDVFEGSLVAVPSQRTEIIEARATEPEHMTIRQAIQARRDLFNAPIEVVTKQAEVVVDITKPVEHDAGRVRSVIERARKAIATIP